MDLETLSNRILDGDFEKEISHNDEPPPDDILYDNYESVEVDTEEVNDSDDELSHYGVLGMKWGVRKDKDRVEKRKKKDRRYEDETDQEYQSRMARESQERISKTQAKAKVKSDKILRNERLKTQQRMLKSQEKLKRMEIKAQQKQKEADIAERIRQEENRKLEEKQRRKDERAAARKAAKEKTKSKPTNARNLTDRELNDAIQRLRNEQTYKQLSLQNSNLTKKTLVKAATIGGGILLTVGTAVATQQLKRVGNEKVEDYLVKHKIIKPPDPKTKGFSQDEVNILKDVVAKLVEQNK